MIKKYVIIYYKNREDHKTSETVYESKSIDRISFPERASIHNLSPKDIEWDYAIIEERHYRE